MTRIPKSVRYIAYRNWLVKNDRLTGTFYPYYWKPGKNEAFCRDPAHFNVESSPGPDCPHKGANCGLHGSHAPPTNLVLGVVQGAIKVWGKLEVAYSGVRAEFAEPVLLSTIFEDDRLPQLADYYGAKIVAFDELELAARDFGEPIPTRLRPPLREISYSSDNPWDR